MATRIEAAAGGSVRGRTVGVLGVTFKPNTDDMREAPSLVILPMLQARGARIRAYRYPVVRRWKWPRGLTC